VAASGALATRMGLSGVPVAAETIALHTIVELMRATGARVHLCRISSAAGVALVRQAKAEGLPRDLRRQHQFAAPDRHRHRLLRQPHAHLNPPLRQQRDRDALRAGWPTAPSTRWCQDHTPVDEDAKTLPFAEASPAPPGGAAAEPGAQMGQDSGAA
jgi:dihydroorotase